MALPPLISMADLDAFGYGPVPDSAIKRASARVRAYTGQQITPGTSTVTLHTFTPVRLPQRPVTAVTSVTDADGNAVPYTLTGSVLHVHPESPLCQPATLTVSYAHGYDTLPDGLIDTVCQVATRLATASPQASAGVRQETADGLSVTYASENFAHPLLPAEREALDEFYPRVRAGTVILG